MVSQFCLFWCFFVLSVSAHSGSLSAFVFFKIIFGRFMPLFGVCEEKQKMKWRRGEEGNPSICLSVVGGGGKLRRVYSRVSSKLGMPRKPPEERTQETSWCLNHLSWLFLTQRSSNSEPPWCLSSSPWAQGNYFQVPYSFIYYLGFTSFGSKLK